ncbi:MAG: hypothetical protein K9G70_11745, partial [Prolixibacteraceae bacterium]|nr:hypothetical protein [Prolixibacteraceae bacterium]
TITLVLFLMIIGIGQLSAQKVVTVKAGNYDISDNLDLEAVAYLFGESENLEVFEMKLNDPELRVSNLDLNYDGYIDYLRVVEVKEGRVFVITIQAVLGNDLYQNVATIDVMLKNRRNVYVQVIGNEYIYGRNYIIEPVFVHRPVIYTYFRYSHRPVWVSPWHWKQYPRYYSYREPYAVHVYHHHVYDYYRPKVKCHYVHKRRVHEAYHLHKKYHRNDFAKSKPNYSFDERNKGVENYRELSQRRSSRPNTERYTGVKAENNSRRKVQNEWRSNESTYKKEQSPARKTYTRRSEAPQRPKVTRSIPQKSKTVSKQTSRKEQRPSVRRRAEVKRQSPSRRNVKTNGDYGSRRESSRRTR